MKRTWKLRVGCLMAIQSVCLGLSAQTAQPKSPVSAPQVVIVELFTSEGCSSCPPADALLREAHDTRTNAGQWIVGISEHVTYWNSLGWNDPFSSSLYTERQEAYSDQLGLSGVYTPQMVVNGTEQFVGSDRAGLARAFKKELATPPQVQLHILSTRVDNDGVVVKFSAEGVPPGVKGDIVAVVADDLDQSSVRRGENSGRTLSHVSVARSLSRVAKLQTIAEQEVRLPLPPAFQSSQKHHVILFAQAPSQGRVLGADTHVLLPNE